MMAHDKKRSTKRRGNGEGSIIERDGRWVAVISMGYDAKGKRIRRWISGDTKKEVQDKLTNLQKQKLDGVLSAPSKITVAAYLDRWTEDFAKQKVRETTLASYRNLIRLHVNPMIGGLKLQSLNALHVQGLYSKLEDAKKSPRLRLMVHAVLHMALSKAAALGLVPRNVCSKECGVERPAVEQAEMNCWNTEQAAKFLEAAAGDRLHAFYVIAVYGGLRQGELIGLRREDVDLEKGIVTVRRAVTDLDGKFIEGPPKSKAGYRQVRLPAAAVEAVQDHLRRMLAEGNAGSEYLFCDRDGGPLRRQNVLRRSFRPLMNAAGVPHIRFHDLRHTNATILLAQGVHPKIVQARLGHSKISVTLDTYSHVLEGMDAAASDVLGEALQKTGS